MGALHHEPQTIELHSGKHPHNGEILPLLKAAPPDPQRIYSAFLQYLNHKRPAYIQADIANGYNYAKCRVQPKHIVLYKSIQFLWNHRRQVWIKHGIEQPDKAHYNSNELYPPMHTRTHVGEWGLDKRHLNRYAVDFDQYPFAICSAHPIDAPAPWGIISGYLPLNSYPGLFAQAPDRDHYYADTPVQTNRWLYVYTDCDDDVDYAPYFEQNMHSIRQNRLMHLHRDTVKEFHHTTSLLQNIAAVKQHKGQ
jgi:hypothetical protein